MVGGLFCFFSPPPGGALISGRVRIQNIISYLYVALNTAFENLDAIFLHGVDHAPTNKWKARLFLIFCSRDVTNTTIRKNTSGHNLSGKNREKGELSVRSHMQLKYEVKCSDRNSQS